jgi:hypothetical protein
LAAVIVASVLAAHCYNRYLWKAKPNHWQELKTRHPGHIEIGNYQVRRHSFNLQKGRNAVLCSSDVLSSDISNISRLRERPARHRLQETRLAENQIAEESARLKKSIGTNYVG